MSLTRRILIVPVALALAGLGVVVVGEVTSRGTERPATASSRGAPTLSDLALPFVENRGQIDPALAFHVPGSPALGFASDGLRVAEGDSQVDVRFVGAREVMPLGARPAETIVNYFVGDRSRWSSGIPTYDRIVYPEPWPGVDAVFARSSTSVKYEFRVDPGAEPGSIRLAYDGASRLSVGDRGDLVARTEVGTIVDRRPIAWQKVAGRRVPIDVAYDVRGATYGFRIGRYDPALPLVIDPEIRFSGFIGGSEDNEEGYGVRVDDRTGAFYVTGTTNSTDFPVTGGDTTNGGNGDGFVVRVKPDGSGLEFATFLGGSDYEYSWGIDIDRTGNSYVTGMTRSTDFPTLVGPDLSHGGDDEGYIAKLNPSGSLIFSGFVGGTASDYVGDIQLGPGDAPIIAGQTRSSDLPVVNGPDTTFNEPGPDATNHSDGFVGRVNPDGSGFSYLGFLGGDMTDYADNLVLDPAGNAFVSLGTDSLDAFTLIAGPGGGRDAAVAGIGPSGNLLTSSRFGGAGDDEGYGVTIGPGGRVFVTGWTNSPDFPAMGGFDSTLGDSTYDGFVAELNSTATGVVRSGFLGGAGDDYAYYIEVDGLGIAYVVGDTDSADFPTAVGPDTSFNEPGPDANNDGDAFITAINPSGTSLRYSSFLGGSMGDYAFGLDLTPGGAPVVVGGTDSSDFPAVVGPDTSFNGPESQGDAFITLLETLHRCKGKQVTLLGTSKRDKLVGRSPDVVLALGGKDRINTKGGRDVVCAGPGKDTVKGGGGKDRLFGQGGKDRLIGGGGKDVCAGGGGKDEAKACERGKA